MNRIIQWLTLAVVSSNSLAPQVAALLTLAPRDFGIFSLGYLTFSLASSVGLSTVSEAYVRIRGSELDDSNPRYYEAISTWLSLIFALLAGLIFLLLTDDLLAVALSILAVGFATRRTTIRYHELRTNSWSQLLTAESTALAVFVAILTMSISPLQPMISILMAWSTSGLTMWLLGTMRKPGTPKGACRWLTQHQRAIRPLLRESVLQETSAIGTPYIISPMLGTAAFGVYRAVSNFSAPVRLVFNFIRPHLASKPLIKTLSKRYLLLAVSSSIAWGAAFSSLLWWVMKRPSGIPMLDALADFWLPTGIYMMFTVLVMYFYLIARTKVSAQNLWHGRVIQTVVSLVFPISGAGWTGLPGAIWGYTSATVIGALMWAIVVQIQARQGND